MKHRDRPHVRLSPPLQAVLERAGDSGAAMRALMVLGAAAVGEDLGPLRREIRLLLADDTLSGALQRALSALSDERQTGVRQVSDEAQAGRLHPVSTPPEAPLMTVEQLDALPAGDDDDPLGSIGFEV
jgi:hypothetical protein